MRIAFCSWIAVGLLAAVKASSLAVTERNRLEETPGQPAAATAAAVPAAPALTQEQRELYAKLRVATTTAGDAAAGKTGQANEDVTEEKLRAVIVDYLSRANMPRVDYQFAVQQSALEGVPDDGGWHAAKVARDIFVLLSGKQLYAFRTVMDCKAKAAASGVELKCGPG